MRCLSASLEPQNKTQGTMSLGVGKLALTL